MLIRNGGQLIPKPSQSLLPWAASMILGFASSPDACEHLHLCIIFHGLARRYADGANPLEVKLRPSWEELPQLTNGPFSSFQPHHAECVLYVTIRY
jgi:hypothetical protein